MDANKIGGGSAESDYLFKKQFVNPTFLRDLQLTVSAALRIVSFRGELWGKVPL
ncbi:hypothetical protein H9Q10_06240 [Eikenella sp. S3360]|uniref:Uncharacterized protein n=1 Tax=Eikenella glucosivorans TaxID=2766967 RepID=A0ABS0NAF3_9NEIS|nr:hypothetical protein [Eikenella glucosivorans]MBH5329268.1 hypothetical protein [Eikenella glucosivorans]